MELLVVIAIIGVLIGLLLPAVQSAREAGRRANCQNNLHQIGVALQAFHSAHREFPAGRDAQGDHEHSWATRVLPQLEQSALFDQYRFDHDWDATGAGIENGRISETTLPVFLCPSAVHEDPGATDYAGNYGTTLTGLPLGFGLGYAHDAGILVAVNVALSAGPQRKSPVRIAEVRDGTSLTCLVLEDAGRPATDSGQWANGHQCIAQDGPPNYSPNNELYSDHPGGAHVLMADGSVRFLSESIELPVLGGLCTRAEGEITALN